MANLDPGDRAAAGAAGATIVVGVVPDQPDDVLQSAATFAEYFDASLCCITVDASTIMASSIDGAWATPLMNPSYDEELRLAAEGELHAQVARALAGRDVRWTASAVIGVPAVELTRIADERDAAMIVVGTREPGIRGTLHELVSGSVAAQLAHRQHRPVTVIPLDPEAIDTRATGA